MTDSLDTQLNREAERTEDSVGVALAKLAGLAEVLAVNYTATGDIDATYLHQLDGALDLVREMGEIQNVHAQLVELAANLASALDLGPTLAIDKRTQQMRNLRLGITRFGVEALTRNS